MELLDKIRKVIEGYYLETTSSLYIPESVVSETIHLICKKTRCAEHFCVYDKNITANLLYTSLQEELRINESIYLKQSFAVMNVKQIDGFLTRYLTSSSEENIENNVILLSNIHIESMPGLFDFILFDNRIVLALDNDNDGGYYLSTDQDLVSKCQQWLNASSISIKELEYFFLQEPLMKSANMVNEVASVLCTKDHVDSGDCYWYHSAWQYLRLMNMVSTPSWHHNFYLERIKESFKGMSSVNVLISGAADYSSLSYAVRALEGINVQGDYSVLDLCETPLFSCQWYAKFKNIKVHTLHQSIFELDASKKYDLICTDAFLTRFKQNEILAILKLWNSALSKEGHVITTVRIHDEQHHCPESPTSDDVIKFREKAVERMKIWGGFINCSVEDISHKAEIYAKKMHSNHIGNKDSIVNKFEEAGFRILYLDDVEIEGELYPSRYLRIDAIKDGG